jgi:hypothetical protein
MQGHFFLYIRQLIWGMEDQILFWIDVWTGEDALTDGFPAPFSHCTQEEASVSQAIHSNLQNSFRCTNVGTGYLGARSRDIEINHLANKFV